MERAAEFRRRQDELEALAVEYFVLQDALEGIDAAAEMEIQAIRDRAAEQTKEASEKIDNVVQRMLGTKVTREEVAERLGIPVRDVKRRKPVTNTGSAREAGPDADRGSDDVDGDAATGDGERSDEQSYAA